MASNLRILIFATSYCANMQQREVISIWARVTRHLNPKTDIVLIDSASPVDLKPICAQSNIEYWSFPDNIGHLNITQRDGWGRAFCKGVEWAWNGEYDYAVNLDADMIFCKPVGSIVERMARVGVEVACPMDPTYNFIETAVSFYSVKYLDRIKFIERYDWEHPPPDMLSNPPERRCETIFGDDLFCLSLRGYRNDYNQVNHQNIRNLFPYGLDYLTHAKDISLYRRLLERNGVKL